MKYSEILKRTIFLGFLFGGIATSHATNIDSDCTSRRVAPDLCTMLNQANADSDTFSVSIFYFHPAKDTTEYCRNLEPKHDTDGRCSQGGYDSAYYAKLKLYSDTMYTKFDLWDAKNPTVRLSPPSSGRQYHVGIVATKATLIEVLKEGYVATMEDWEEYGPARILSRAAPATEILRSEGGFFLPDGRSVSGQIGMKTQILLNGSHR